MSISTEFLRSIPGKLLSQELDRRRAMRGIKLALHATLAEDDAAQIAALMCCSVKTLEAALIRAVGDCVSAAWSLKHFGEGIAKKDIPIMSLEEHKAQLAIFMTNYVKEAIDEVHGTNRSVDTLQNSRTMDDSDRPKDPSDATNPPANG